MVKHDLSSLSYPVSSTSLAPSTNMFMWDTVCLLGSGISRYFVTAVVSSVSCFIFLISFVGTSSTKLSVHGPVNRLAIIYLKIVQLTNDKILLDSFTLHYKDDKKYLTVHVMIYVHAKVFLLCRRAYCV